ncbi:hypothetical protein CsSME_00016689 [Camellia sinensis var. sinensis]
MHVVILVSRHVTKPKLIPGKFWSQPSVVPPVERPLVIQELLASYNAKPIGAGLGRDKQ